MSPETPQLFPADPLADIRHRVARCGESTTPACQDRAQLLAHHDAREEQVKQVLRGLLKPEADPAWLPGSLTDIRITRHREHNRPIHEAAAALGITDL